jgi:ribosomal protein S12 methylthiotransferase accessory factor
VTRIGFTTGLDRIGIPTCYAIRPSALDPNVVYSSGKGFDCTQAINSAVFESFERWAAEEAKCVVHTTSQELRKVAPDLDLIIYAPERLDPHLVLPWALGRQALTGEPAAAPTFLVTFPSTGIVSLPNSTTGFAAHVQYSCAIETGILECVERHVTASLSLEKLSRVTAEQYSRKASQLIDIASAEAIELHIFAIDNPFGISVIYVFGYDHWLGVPQSHCSGFAASLSPSDAIDKALLEFAQSRAAFLTGLRADVPEHVLAKSIDLNRLNYQQDWLHTIRKISRVTELRHLQSNRLATHMERIIGDFIMAEPAIFPLRDIGVGAAVRVLIPELRDSF